MKMVDLAGLKPGDTVDNKQLRDIFKCSPQGGMRRSRTTNTLVLVSNHVTSIYDDRWMGDTFHYTGMGQEVIYTRSVDESRAIMEQTFPHIIIAGSGMATGGRILHHFKRLLGSPNTTVLFAGYQAGGTRGAKMLDGADGVKIHGKWIRIRARVESISGLSAHADYAELLH